MRKNQSAFTLLEIMLVVTIIALLLGTAIYKLSGNVEYARHNRVAPTSRVFRHATEALREHERLLCRRPSRVSQALVAQPSSDPQPQRWYQLFKEMPNDPWDNNYIYRNPGRKNPSGYDLYSAGQDRKPDTPDDDWGGS